MRIGREEMASWSRTLVTLTLLVATGCPATGGVDVVEQERMNIASWTLPPGASVTTVTASRKTSLSAGGSWEISSPMTWSEYREWNKERAKTGYVDTRSDDKSLGFSRNLPSDQFFVDIRLIAPGPPVRLRVTFTAVPD